MNYEYKLRVEDFIPVLGLVIHCKRSMNGMLIRNLICSDTYAANAWARDSLLIIYNTAMIVGTIAGLERLLSK